MTPKEYKQMMDYLTRSGVKKQVKFASDTARPDPKPVVKEIELFNAFNRRNPKADGGMLVQPGFGGTRQGYKQDIKPPTKKQLQITEKVYGKKYNKTGIDLWESLKQFERSNIRQKQTTGGTGGIPGGKIKKNMLSKDDFIKLVNQNKDKTYNQFVEILKDYKTKDNKPFTNSIVSDRLRQYGLSGSFKKEPPKGNDPTVKAAAERKRQASLKESDPTKAKGTKKFNYHHITQIEGGIPITSDDVLIINQRINSQLGGETNKALNRISAAIRKNNKLALEAMNNKQEGLALDYMKRSDELNARAEKIVNSAIDKLPKKYKGYVGFKQFTLPRDEYGLPISNEPIIIRKVGGMPVSKDAIDLTTLNLKQEKEFRDLVKTQAQAGKTGQIKGLAAFIKRNFPDGEIVCNLSKGINCNNPQAYLKSINQLTQKAKQGDEAARATLTNFTNKAAAAGRLVKNALGPLAIASEIAIEGGIALNKTLQTGVPLKTAFADSLFNLALGPKLQIDKEAELAKEFAKGEDFAMAERGRRMMIPQSATADAQRQRERMEQMASLYPQYSDQQLISMIEDRGFNPQDIINQKTTTRITPAVTSTLTGLDQLRTALQEQDALQRIADAGGVANLAGGGIAGLSGGKKSGPPPISGPTPDGDEGLPAAFKNVRKR